MPFGIWPALDQSLSRGSRERLSRRSAPGRPSSPWQARQGYFSNLVVRLLIAPLASSDTGTDQTVMGLIATTAFQQSDY